MMTVLRTLLLLVACLACSVVQAREYQFNLDVPGGHFSYFKFDEVPAAGSLEGTARFLEIREGKWLPLISLTAEAADGRRLTQQFIATKGGRTIVVKLFLGNDEVSVANFDVEKNVALPVAMSWTGSGEFSLAMPDGTARKIDFAAPAYFRVSVSSAEVEGKNWVVRAARP
jgi:hypothetical protein